MLIFVDRGSKIGEFRAQSDLNSRKPKNKTKIPEGNDEKLFEKDKKLKNSQNRLFRRDNQTEAL